MFSSNVGFRNKIGMCIFSGLLKSIDIELIIKRMADNIRKTNIDEPFHCF